MLSSVLHSLRAVQANVAIIRAFVRLRLAVDSHRYLARRLDELEKRYDARFGAIFVAIRRLMSPSGGERRPIGFRAPDKR